MRIKRWLNLALVMTLAVGLSAGCKKKDDPTYVTETNYATFTANADGPIAFEQGGSGDANAAVFAAFKLENHEGTVETKDGETVWSYRAIELE